LTAKIPASFLTGSPDDTGNLYIPQKGRCLNMPTAIVWFNTPEGFVIASDGRNRDACGNIASDDTQKIFSVAGQGFCLAYGVAGTARIGDGQNRTVFSFPDEIPHSFAAIKGRRSWFDYLCAVASDLETKLNAARAADGKPLDKELETWLFVGGVYGKFQKTAHIVFHHHITESDKEVCPHPPIFTFGPFGSGKVFECIDGCDERFAEFIEPKRSAVRTVAAAIERAEKDVRAHCTPEALDTDPETCAGIGGRIQIATVTFTRGFEWVDGFEPIKR
jgi:hypothetical protein